MHDSVGLHVVQCRGDLSDVFPDFELFDGGVLVASMFYNSFEVASLRPLDSNVHLVVLDESVQISDDVRVV